MAGSKMILKRNILAVCVILVFTCLALFLQGQLTQTDDTHFGVNKSKELVEVLLKYYNYSEGDNLNGPSISMDDPRLIAKIAKNFILSPPQPPKPYNLDDPIQIDTSMGQAEKIMEVLGHKKNGFFIECGALDGETRSNTLVFERTLNWTGLLIEADPSNFGHIVSKHRRAYLSPTCLSIKKYPMMVSFMQAYNIGKISGFPPGHRQQGYVDVQCFPLYSYLLAMNRTTVDYFSLDVEGNELDVLETIPFDKIDIQTLSVEYFHVPRGKEALKEFMEKKGYIVDSEVVHANNLANDFIFVKPSLRDVNNLL